MGKEKHITLQSDNHAFKFKLFSYAWVELHHSSDNCTWPHVETSKFNTHNLHINPYEYHLARVAWKKRKSIFATDKAKYCNFWAISLILRVDNCVLRLKQMEQKVLPSIIRDGNVAGLRGACAEMVRAAWYPWQSFGTRRDQSHSSPISQAGNALPRELQDWPNELINESE